MYIRSLHLENIACFAELDLDFTDNSDGYCKWVVLLGENGTGKSSICHMIALNLLHQDRINLIAGDTDWGKFVNSEELRGISFSVVRNDEYDTAESVDLSAKIYYSPKSNKNISSVVSHIDNYYKLSPDEIIAKLKKADSYGVSSADQWAIKGGYFSCGYGIRKNSISKYQRSNSESSLNSFRFSSLIGDGSGTTGIDTWISDLYFKTIHESKTEKDLTIFNIATAAIDSLLPDMKFSHVSKERRVYFKSSSGLIEINQMSDGYRFSTEWVIDLTRRMCDAFPELDNPLQASGVVLVDEIDLHLHPRWQRTVVKQIRETFPNLQFIVTTHSPFIVQDMTENDKIIILKRDGDRVVAEHRTGIAGGWRASQILTSPFFGLATDFDEEIEEKILERQAHGDKKAQGLLTDEEREELRQVTEYLDSVRADATETGDELLSAEHLDREAVRKAAAVALRLLRKVEGK